QTPPPSESPSAGCSSSLDPLATPPTSPFPGCRAHTQYTDYPLSLHPHQLPHSAKVPPRLPSDTQHALGTVPILDALHLRQLTFALVRTRLPLFHVQDVWLLKPHLHLDHKSHPLRFHYWLTGHIKFCARFHHLTMLACWRAPDSISVPNHH